MENSFNKKPEELIFYFSTARYSIAICNVVEIIKFNKFSDMSAIFRELKHGGELKGKIIVGAFPFDKNEKGYCYLADKIINKDGREDKKDSVYESRYDVTSISYIPSPDAYMDNVEKGLEYIIEGELEKLVLSRAISFTLKNKIDINKVVELLNRNNPTSYIYTVKIDDKYFVGASPELLVSKRKEKIVLNPLAGSRPRGNCNKSDRELANVLKYSKKDLHEHRIVVNDILNNIKGVCRNIEYSCQPELIKTSQLWHLSTVINAKIFDSEQPIFKLAEMIHPTPAVCGFPIDRAYEKILEIEGDRRGLFTGIVGWCDENGDGDLAILIRGAEICGSRVKAQAGAGIVKGSIPEEELKETGVKMKTILKSLGIENLVV